ncbi:chloride channel protein [Hydrogenophaga crassostreae]|uniref:chloride channel protein n=1 Tax=Hydrogenophaga crassostreae TaxID=1763535 RepID=UPI0009ED4392|nr:chloride channel protein [Hydrogenophaga crassostreae]
MNREPDFFQNIRNELHDGRAWLDRSIVLGYAVMAGLFVVAFTLLSEAAFEWFQHLNKLYPWGVLIWTPTLTALIVWATRRFFPGASGSGIPQVMAAIDPEVNSAARRHFVSFRLTIAKMGLGTITMLAGLSAGREGPSVQVAAGVMHGARHWLRPGSAINDHALLVAGGAAGIAAAFNAPLAGVVFAIEELSKRMDSRNNSVIISAIVVAGLVSISFFGNLTYFGTIAVPRLSWAAFWPGLVVVVVCGLLGGLFARLLAASIEGLPDRFSRWRHKKPVRFAAGAGLAVAAIGIVSGGATYGAGADELRNMLAGESDISRLYVLLKFVATWITSWSGVPGGIFAPSLSIGAGVGHDVAQLFAGTNSALAPSLIALGMAAYLAAATQAPLTSFIIVMEMINGRSMVLSLMAAAMLASLIARLISRPLYHTLSSLMINAVFKTNEPPERSETDAAEAPADAVTADGGASATPQEGSPEAVLPSNVAPQVAPETPAKPSVADKTAPQGGLFDHTGDEAPVDPGDAAQPPPTETKPENR